MWALNKEGATI